MHKKYNHSGRHVILSDKNVIRLSRLTRVQGQTFDELITQILDQNEDMKKRLDKLANAEERMNMGLPPYLITGVKSDEGNSANWI